MLLGLFTVSWDRVASISIIGFNLKLPTAAFAVSAVLVMIDCLVLGRTHIRPRVVTGFVVVTLGVLGLRGMLAEDPRAAMLQLVAVVLGAVIPLLAVSGCLALYSGVDQALTIFIRGGFCAAFFGIYQLAAFYVGAPQFVTYQDVGGSLGRISAFSYEAGYFGYFMVLILGALYARASLREVPVSNWQVAFVLGVLLLANTRAVALTVPLFFLLLLARADNRTRLRAGVVGLLGLWSALLVWLLVPSYAQDLRARMLSIADPTEEASNAVRLANLESISQILSDHWIFGVGPGNLLAAQQDYGLPLSYGTSPNTVVANNIYYQALLDGGIAVLVAEIAFVVLLTRRYYWSGESITQPLMAGYLAVVIPASFITSYFWDIKLWATMGLVIGAGAWQFAGPDSGCEPKSRQGVWRRHTRTRRHVPDLPLAGTLQDGS